MQAAKTTNHPLMFYEVSQYYTNKTPKIVRANSRLVEIMRESITGINQGIAEFLKINPQTNKSRLEDDIDKIKLAYNKFASYRTKEEFKQWAKDFKDKGLIRDQSNIYELIAAISRARELISKATLRDVQYIALLIFIDSSFKIYIKYDYQGY